MRSIAMIVCCTLYGVCIPGNERHATSYNKFMPRVTRPFGGIISPAVHFAAQKIMATDFAAAIVIRPPLRAGT
jgi:hypothetical protein